MNIQWFPTLSCNLKCSYCNARSFPVATHGRERGPAAWIAQFEQCPVSMTSFGVSGGEPSEYAQLEDVLAALMITNVWLNTNLMRPPERWLRPAALYKVHAVTATCQFNPALPQATGFFENLRWLKDHLRPGAALRAWYVREPQRTTDQEVAEFKRRAVAAGATETQINDVTDKWGFRDWLPGFYGRALSCTGGNTLLSILPDGEVYRCITHAMSGSRSMGNLFELGWDVIHKTPQPCEDLRCNFLPECEPVKTVWEEGNPPRPVPGPGRRWQNVR